MQIIRLLTQPVVDWLRTLAFEMSGRHVEKFVGRKAREMQRRKSTAAHRRRSEKRKVIGAGRPRRSQL